MRWFLVPIFAFVFAVLQSSLFLPGLLAVRSARPDLLLVLALFMALQAAPYDVFIAAWCLGFVEDLLTDQLPLGVTALLFALVAFGLSRIRRSLIYDRILTQVVLAVVVVLLVRCPQMLLLVWWTEGGIGLDSAVRRGLGDALYTALLAPYLLWLLAKTVSQSGRLRGATH